MPTSPHRPVPPSPHPALLGASALVHTVAWLYAGAWALAATTGSGTTARAAGAAALAVAAPVLLTLTLRAMLRRRGWELATPWFLAVALGVTALIAAGLEAGVPPAGLAAVALAGTVAGAAALTPPPPRALPSGRTGAQSRAEAFLTSPWTGPATVAGSLREPAEPPGVADAYPTASGPSAPAASGTVTVGGPAG